MSYFDTHEYAALHARRTELTHSCGNLRRSDDPEVRIVDQMIADGYWHHDNPNKTGSWRLAYRGMGGIAGEFTADNRIPRFETEADCAAFIAANGHAHYLAPIYRESRQTIAAREARMAPIAEAA